MDPLVASVLDLIRLLQDAYKVYLKNSKLMLFLVLLLVSLCSLLYLTNFFSIRPLISDLLVKQSLLLLTSPSSPEFATLILGLLNDLKFLVGVEWLFVLVFSITSFFSAVATIYASATTHAGKETSVSNLLVTTLRSWKPLVTALYITLFNLGYTFFCVVVLLPLLLPGFSGLSVAALVLAGAFYAYLAVVWNMSLVISVLEEECYGIEALGKAAKLVRGAQFLGFVLNLGMIVLSWVISQAWRLIVISPSTIFIVFVGLLVVNGSLLLRMLGYTAYTVFYLDCKERAGEVIDFPGGDVEYTKVSSLPLISDVIP